MKHIIIAFALLGATTASYAQNWTRPTAGELKEERQSLSAKTTALETMLTKHQTDKAEQAASELLTTMKMGVAQTRRVAETSGAQKDAIMKTMLQMEQMVFDFRALAADVNKNGAKLLETAKAFQTKLPQ